jgi:hypothetical protein
MLQSRNKCVQQFLDTAYNDLNEHQITVKVYKKRIDNRFDIDGYFDDVSREIAIRKNRHWLETFVHEYAHFLQWKNNDPSFAAYYKCAYNPVRMIEMWLNRRTPYDRRVKHSFEVVRVNEIQCDKLALHLIRKHNLPINHENYTRRANRQIIFYHCVEHKRTWDPSHRFYGKQLCQMIPVNIRTSYAHNIPSRLLQTALELF